MEGTYTTADALALAETDDAGITDPQTIEVRNYIRALELAQRLLTELPISSRLIKLIHQSLLSGVAPGRGTFQSPGEFKIHQNFIGGGNRQIENARFVPPPPAETLDSMADLERYIHRHNRGGIPPIIDAALIHYQFEAIHPFADGNGRVGRILVPIHLMNVGVLDRPLLYVSPAAEGRKDDYVELLLNVSKTGDWTTWIEFFLQLIVASCEKASETIAELERLRNEYRRRISTGRMSARLLMLADHLFMTPVITIPRAAELLGVTYPAAKNAIERLIELEILEELFLASLHVFDDPTNLPHHPKRFICRAVVTLSGGAQSTNPPQQTG